MGRYFHTSDDLIHTFSVFYDELKYNPAMGPRLAASRIIIRFEYRNPAAAVTIDARNRPAEPGAYATFVWNAAEPEPEAVIRITADYAHRFWHGRENPFLGAATGKIQITGNRAKVLALLPAFQPAYRLYPDVLRRMGRPDLVVK